MSTSQTTPQHIVLLHGVWLPAWTLAWLARRLQQRGYVCHRYSYPTLTHNLDDNAERLRNYLQRLNLPQPHIVAHSLGGLLVQHMLRRNPDVSIGRIVMLGTPLRGSYVGDVLMRHAPTRFLLGRSLRQHFTTQSETHDLLGEVGMIAGNAGVGFGMIFPGLAKPHDGTVSVAETRDPGLKDHIILAESHSTVLFSARVVQCIDSFFTTAAFHAVGPHA